MSNSSIYTTNVQSLSISHLPYFMFRTDEYMNLPVSLIIVKNLHLECILHCFPVITTYIVYYF